MLQRGRLLLMLLIVLSLTLALAFANGANDISKGIATLVGSGVSNYRAAIAWGTVWTVAGGLTAAMITQALLATFSGKGLLSIPVTGNAFLFAVACASAGWLLIATRTGLPVSTTHALTGALCGAGIAAAGVSGVLWHSVIWKTMIPLAASPLMSLAIVMIVAPVTRYAFPRVNEICVCVNAAQPMTNAGIGPEALPRITIARECAPTPSAQATRVQLIDWLHWLCAGATSFFRGVNDTPKIVALGFAAAATLGITAVPFYALVVLAIGAGSLLWGFRVTDTLAKKVTTISPPDGFSANLVTSALVACASFVALPVSTTHVSSGSILGTGLARGGETVRWKTVVEILLAWLITLPVSGILGWTIYRIVA